MSECIHNTVSLNCTYLKSNRKSEHAGITDFPGYQKKISAHAISITWYKSHDPILLMLTVPDEHSIPGLTVYFLKSNN